MKNTTNPQTTTSTQKTRFNFLKSVFHQAPLGKVEYEELTTLAKKFDKKMAAYLEANPTICCCA